jgi:hypothetical protein
MTASEKEILKSLAPPAIITVVLLFVVWLIYRKMTAPGKDMQTIQDDINASHLSYPKAQYQSFADAIQTAVEGTWGDDEEAIYDVFKMMKTNSDVLQLEIAWGRRTFFNLRDGLYYSASLAEVLHGQLSASELQKINEILAENGVTITI